MYVTCVIGCISVFIFITDSESNFDKRSPNVSKSNNIDLFKVYGYDNEEFDLTNGEDLNSIKVNYSRRSVPCVNITQNKTVCFCSQDGSFTDCSRRNLTFFPVVPRETTTLNMSGNSLKSLDLESLSNISTLSKRLKSLDVSKNDISHIANGTLSSFTALRALNISVNLVSNTAIENLTSGISTKLEILMLEELNMKEFPYKTMPHLNNTSLLTLSVKYNDIKNVNTSMIFPYMKMLQRLDLSFNSIRDINIAHSASLNSLSLSSNELTGIPHCCRNVTNFPKLRFLFLDDNCIRKLRTDHLDCLDSLLLLNISATRIERIPTNAFSGFKSLERLTLERTESLSHIEPYAFNSSSLHRVYIRYNHLMFNRHQVDTRTIFKLSREIWKLDLSGNTLSPLKNTDWTYLLKNVSNLIYLDIGNSGILFLPISIPKYLHRLQVLHVANTGVHFIPKGYFSPLTELRVLFLNGNKLTTITAQDFPPSLTNHLEYISVAFNPFVCNCDLLWFIEFAKKYEHKMEYYPKHYECSKIKWKQISHFKINRKSCLLRKKTTDIIKCTCIATMFLLLVMSIVYRYRWRLRYMLYVLKFKRRKCYKIRQIPFIYDVYVSSADSNFNTVYYQIITELENKGLQVYFPYRDGTPGTLVLGDCLDKIDNSKYVLLCLSNAYAQDNLCEFEAHMALERMYEHCDNNPIIVVVLEEICSVNVTKIIHKLTRSGDYLKWNENPANDDLFWRQICEILEVP